ncbi:MAG: hypothetical protein ACE367_24620 [Acidimicrobiales bacterium]
MSLTLENLRLAAALVHAAPQAELQLTCDGDRHVIVSSHPAADIDICAFRRVVMASACPARPNPSEWIHDVVIGGSLTAVGGGAYVSNDGSHERHWFATLLRPERVCALLENLDVAEMPDGAMTATLKPDPGLGVTVISTTIDEFGSQQFGTEVATAALQACLVEELVIDTHNSRDGRTQDPRSTHVHSETHTAIRSDRTDRRPPA